MEINPKKFILTFKANGVSVFVTDIHKNVYYNLEVLFTIENGVFKQYFTEKAFNNALNKGLSFYKNGQKVKKYKINLRSQCKNFKKFFKSSIANKKYISKQTLQKFFTYTILLCKEYTKMNIEFTDKAFSYKLSVPTIKQNLDRVMKFKDEVRSFMNLVLFETNGYSNILFKILGKQFKLSPAILENLTQKELLNLYSGKKINSNLVLKRQNAFVIVWKQALPFEGSKARTIIKKFNNQSITEKEVRGQVANKGKVLGKVKIISVDYSNLVKVNLEIGQMQKNDILIAETTAPELIIACKKAAAIVTDLGGLMSHAAIVSRELGIPCIIGTKIATKVFKDGDIVEVDANKGIVRKIK